MNNNKNRLLLCAVLLSVILVSTIFGARLFVDEPTDSLLPGVNLNTLFENDKPYASAVKKTNTRHLSAMDRQIRVPHLVTKNYKKSLIQFTRVVKQMQVK